MIPIIAILLFLYLDVWGRGYLETISLRRDVVILRY